MKNVLKFLSLSTLLACFALFTGSVFAQSSTTGAIEGTVTDSSGAAVPGASIKVTGVNLISAQSATSDDTGRFRVLNLPPGKYAVTIEADKGFAKFEKTDVEVNLSRNSNLEVQLQPAGASASVTVTDTAGAGVDLSANTSGSNVSTDQFSNFPTQRTVQGLYTLAPTVTRSGLRDATGRDRDPSGVDRRLVDEPLRVRLDGQDYEFTLDARFGVFMSGRLENDDVALELPRGTLLHEALRSAVAATIEGEQPVSFQFNGRGYRVTTEKLQQLVAMQGDSAR